MVDSLTDIEAGLAQAHTFYAFLPSVCVLWHGLWVSCVSDQRKVTLNEYDIYETTIDLTGMHSAQKLAGSLQACPARSKPLQIKAKNDNKNLCTTSMTIDYSVTQCGHSPSVYWRLDREMWMLLLTSLLRQTRGPHQGTFVFFTEWACHKNVWNNSLPKNVVDFSSLVA